MCLDQCSDSGNREWERERSGIYETVSRITDGKGRVNSHHLRPGAPHGGGGALGKMQDENRLGMWKKFNENP